MLSTKVKSTVDLMSIALQAEREAIRRYSRLAENMREGGNESAAALFERMVDEEQEHARLLLEWMEKESITPNPDIGPIRWRDPHVSTTYNDEARDPRYSSPYRALAFAVNNEENAFRFYTHVAAEADDEAVRRYAEILAREELAHAALLRAERRVAYHAERKASGSQAVDPKKIESEAQLLSTAIEIDRYLVDALDKAVVDTPQLAGLAVETRQQISDNENELKRLPAHDDDADGARIANALAQSGPSGSSGGMPPTALQQLDAYCDASFAFYDAVVETSKDESLMHSAQRLTSRALDRIGVIRQLTSGE